jgi:hypothetical protein
MRSFYVAKLSDQLIKQGTCYWRLWVDLGRQFICRSYVDNLVEHLYKILTLAANLLGQFYLARDYPARIASVLDLNTFGPF